MAQETGEAAMVMGEGGLDNELFAHRLRLLRQQFPDIEVDKELHIGKPEAVVLDFYEQMLAEEGGNEFESYRRELDATAVEIKGDHEVKTREVEVGKAVDCYRSLMRLVERWVVEMRGWNVAGEISNNLLKQPDLYLSKLEPIVRALPASNLGTPSSDYEQRWLRHRCMRTLALILEEEVFACTNNFIRAPRDYLRALERGQELPAIGSGGEGVVDDWEMKQTAKGRRDWWAIHASERELSFFKDWGVRTLDAGSHFGIMMTFMMRRAANCLLVARSAHETSSSEMEDQEMARTATLLNFLWLRDVGLRTDEVVQLFDVGLIQSGVHSFFRKFESNMSMVTLVPGLFAEVLTALHYRDQGYGVEADPAWDRLGIDMVCTRGAERLAVQVKGGQGVSGIETVDLSEPPGQRGLMRGDKKSLEALVAGARGLAAKPTWVAAPTGVAAYMNREGIRRI